MFAGIALMCDKPMGNLAMDLRSCPSIIGVHYLVQLRHLCICFNLTNSFFATQGRNGLASDNPSIAFTLLLFIRNLVTITALFPSQLDALGSIDFTLL
tara:strand:- start:2179 stop:2472 length:294 start_codon:yes stop_codon:yes gene_type:complete